MTEKNTKKPEIRVTGPVLPHYGIWIESHRHQQDFSTDMHAHKYTSLVYVVSGQGRCITKGKEYPLSANSVILLNQSQRHQLIDEIGKAMVVLVVYFSQQLPLIDKNITQPLFRQRLVVLPPHHATAVREMLRKMLYEQNNKPAHYEIAIRQCLASIMLNLYRAVDNFSKDSDEPTGKKSVDRVASVLDYIETNYYQSHGLSEATRSAHLSQRQFTNICRKLKGKSFVQFLNLVRSQQARRLLEKTDMAVSAIAFEVGFEELSTFYRAFKKHQGLNPLSFRR